MRDGSSSNAIALNGSQVQPDLRAALCLALCAQQAVAASVLVAGPALCVELLADGKVPDWIKLIPAGELLQSPRDGRRWRNPDPAAVLAATVERGLPLPVDFDHASEFTPMQRQGNPAPAAGWIEELQVRPDADGKPGAIWGRVGWTQKGADALRQREFRFVSPAFLHTLDDRRILFLSSAALSNSPAFPELALNSVSPALPNTPEVAMIDKALLALLGLPETATLEQALAAIQKLKEDRAQALAQAQTPSLDKFVPRAEFDAKAKLAADAQTALAARVQDDHKAKVETAINAAIAAGKVTPANKDFYLATCQTAEGLAAFEKFAKDAPVVAGPSGLEGKNPADKSQGAAGLTADQLAVCSRMGLKPEDYAQALA